LPILRKPGTHGRKVLATPALTSLLIVGRGCVLVVRLADTPVQRLLSPAALPAQGALALLLMGWRVARLVGELV
jgi:hypothetical protein